MSAIILMLLVSANLACLSANALYTEIMPTRSYPWNLIDEIAQPIIQRMIEDTGLSYRAFADKTGGLIKYTRVRDICLAKNAPVRLSEFFSICDVCGADPVDVTRRIKETARANGDHEDISAMSDEERIAVAKREYAEKPWELAALHDPNKKIEMMGDAGPDWDDPA